MKAGKHNNYSYNKDFKSLARKLRNNATYAEASLWKYVLRARQMRGYGFRRQRPIDRFIVDFMCKELMLVIEVDGITHTYEETVKKDIAKTSKLKELGFTVLRFTDDEVLTDINGVYHSIAEWIDNSDVPPPSPRQRGNV